MKTKSYKNVLHDPPLFLPPESSLPILSNIAEIILRLSNLYAVSNFEEKL